MSEGKMFERRELVRVVTVPSKHLQRNIQSSILMYLKSHVEGRCGVEGYVQPKTSVIINYSLGSVTSSTKMGISYRVRFQADICFPHKGQILRAPVTLRSKIGVHAETSPLRVLLPRDLHIGNTDFEQIVEKDEVEFEVLGAEFKQNDEQMFVLARLIKRIPAASETSEEVKVPVVEEEKPATKAPGAEEVKQVTIQPQAEGEPKEKVRRKRKLGTAAAVDTNVGNNGRETIASA
uniref:S1 motif domain-containing protein n=1 Tax=viral metagenome TaxID=1070528 RepID=A0A6C0K6G0_9ZZZZ